MKKILISFAFFLTGFSAFADNNTNAELDGNVAELIVYDRVLTDSERKQIESYLAIKYGITITGGTDVLGSTVGNNAYNYVNSTGTSIWNSDISYKFDVFGLGRDDAYGLNQKVSKSINNNTILTVSTNSDVTSLNLDSSRTPINGNQEYILFGNNTGSSSLPNFQATELPPNINSRLNREWKSFLTSTPSATTPMQTFR